MGDGLADKHPIERILMMGRQARQLKNGWFIQREIGDPVHGPVLRNEPYQTTINAVLRKYMQARKQRAS